MAAMTDDPKQSRISRRAFLGAAGVGVAAGAVIGISGSVAVAKSQGSGTSSLPKTWDKTADVVVVGSGMAAYCAAVMAASKGASGIMVEKASIYGGDTPQGGGWGGPKNAFLGRARVKEPTPDAVQYNGRRLFPTPFH